MGVVDTANSSTVPIMQHATQHVPRIEIRIMRLRKDKGVRIKGALQTTQDPRSERT